MDAHKLSFSALDLQQLGDPQSFERAQKYFFADRVRNLYQQGDRFRGIVQGSNRYLVNLWQHPLSAWCNCPYTGPGACKHILVTGMALLAGKPEVETWPEVDFSVGEPALPFLYLSQISVEAVKEDLVTEKLPLQNWEKLFQTFWNRGHWLEMMDLSLALFEALPGQFPLLKKHWPEAFADRSPAPVLSREMWQHFFDRWYEAERKTELSRLPNPYLISQWSSILLPLISSPLAAQFCRIRLEAYGQNGDPWQEVWDRIKAYS
jgi:hypothetical protein